MHLFPLKIFGINKEAQSPKHFVSVQCSSFCYYVIILIKVFVLFCVFSLIIRMAKEGPNWDGLLKWYSLVWYLEGVFRAELQLTAKCDC